ncbi:hypothetical protein GCM10027160_34830 [Streptomyces calidiresistens]
MGQPWGRRHARLAPHALIPSRGPSARPGASRTPPTGAGLMVPAREKSRIPARPNRMDQGGGGLLAFTQLTEC